MSRLVAWRASHALATIFFTMAATVQINDPDWYTWMPLYGITALLSIALLVRTSLKSSRVWNTFSSIHLVTCGVYGIYLASLFLRKILRDDDTGLSPLEMEEGRELIGVMLIVVYLLASKYYTANSTEAHDGSRKQSALAISIIIIVGAFPLLFWLFYYDAEKYADTAHCKGAFSDKTKEEL